MMAARSFSVALLAACLLIMQGVEVDAVPAGGRQLLNKKPTPSCDYFHCPKIKGKDCMKKKGVCHPNNHCSGQTYGYCEKNCGRHGVSCFYAYKGHDVVCRPSCGKCDIAEYCTGTSADCPTDTYQPDTYVCRPAHGDCDLPETCTGHSGKCPYDGPRKGEKDGVCKKATKLCENDAVCDGKSRYCPDTTPKDAHTVCGKPMGPCDEAEYCDGKSKDCPHAEYVCVAKGGASPDDFMCKDNKHYLF